LAIFNVDSLTSGGLRIAMDFDDDAGVQLGCNSPTNMTEIPPCLSCLRVMVSHP
jgi:hypothetical protein